MKTLITSTITTLILASCADAPLAVCDRDSQPYHKFGTTEDQCEIPTITPTWVIEDGYSYSRPSTHLTPPATPDTPNTPNIPDTPTSVNKTKGNNGWGNGDQSAPGKSLNHNKAENSNKTQRNHGEGNPN